MQATRGASLSSSDRSTIPTRPGARRRQLILFATIAVLGYAADLVTKTLAVNHLRPGVPVDIVGSFFTFFIARNPGAAFSTGTSYTLLLSFVAIGAAVAVLWVARRLGSTGWAIGLGFLLAGVLGNLTDRIFREPGVLRGHVVDFLSFPHFPVFNVADMCINVAAVFVILQAVRGVSVSGERHSDEDGRGTEGTPDTGSDPS
jgi:signal peptidase II